jgi:DNA-binding SARP family transcriptional activator
VRELAIGGAKQRAVLAMLVADPGRVIPADYLVDALWHGAAPPGASTTLRSYMSRLRTALAPGAALVAQGGGYALMADPRQIGAARFEALVKSGNDGLSTGDPAAANRFAEALALWRGPALAGVSEVEPLAREAARLIGELERLVGEHPSEPQASG